MKKFFHEPINLSFVEFHTSYGTEKHSSCVQKGAPAVTQFSDEDRERIRTEMIDAGHKLFAQYGFNRTRVSDVTDAVDIGTSTFYQFFDSKEELYLAVLIAERERLLEQLEAAVAEVEKPQAEAEMILRTTLEQVRSNTLIRRLFVDGEIRRLDDHLNGTKYDDTTKTGDKEASDTCRDETNSTTRSHEESDLTRVLPQPDEWVARDDVRIDDPEIVRGLLQSLLFVTQAQDTPVVPDESYDEIEEALIDIVITGLFADKSMISQS